MPKTVPKFNKPLIFGYYIHARPELGEIKWQWSDQRKQFWEDWICPHSFCQMLPYRWRLSSWLLEERKLFSETISLGALFILVDFSCPAWKQPKLPLEFTAELRCVIVAYFLSRFTTAQTVADDQQACLVKPNFFEVLYWRLPDNLLKDMMQGWIAHTDKSGNG